MAVIVRLILIVSVLLMPLGMAAPAAAASAHHGPVAGMPLHCPDDDSSKSADTGFGQCTMACAAALPAVDTPAAHTLFVADVPTDPRPADRLSNLVPATDPPPPKQL